MIVEPADLYRPAAAALGVALLLAASVAGAVPIDSALYTQNNLRECGGITFCVGGEPSIELTSDFDTGATGSVSTRIFGPTIGTQSATSAGYDGSSFTPAISAYAFTDGPVRYSIGVLGLQRYEFVDEGEVTLAGNLTYAQSGQTAPTFDNPRGKLVASFMAFQMENDIFDPENCNVYNLFSGPGAFNEGGAINQCLSFNGQNLGGIDVVFDGLMNFEQSLFDTGDDATDAGVLSQSLSVTGSAGDVFYLATSLGGFAHLGGFWDSRTTLTVDIDRPELVSAAFQAETFTPAPVPIPLPGTLALLCLGLFTMAARPGRAGRRRGRLRP